MDSQTSISNRIDANPGTNLSHYDITTYIAKEREKNQSTSLSLYRAHLNFLNRLVCRNFSANPEKKRLVDQKTFEGNFDHKFYNL